MQAVVRLEPNAALLLIDLQQGIREPRLGRRNHPEAEARIAGLLARWRETGRTVVHVRHLSREADSVFRPGQPGVEFQPAFLPRAGEQVLDKKVPDAFTSGELAPWLHRQAIGQLVVVGGITNNSVESTARTAGNLGFSTIVVADATYTFDRHDLDGRLWRAEEIQALSLANLAMDYACILDTAALLALS
ncbi:cysteine hydrolase family protein [Burkholderia gladioli]|uniref:cysteine hydrolase family protein n=1 Tax=Burkholderia gladioli TaxID=28095 RepID=UPI00163E9615|nr:cysteine hydrolase family protein [Burkholderia gladioli]